MINIRNALILDLIKTQKIQTQLKEVFIKITHGDNHGQKKNNWHSQIIIKDLMGNIHHLEVTKSILMLMN